MKLWADEVYSVTTFTLAKKRTFLPSKQNEKNNAWTTKFEKVNPMEINAINTPKEKKLCGIHP